MLAHVSVPIGTDVESVQTSLEEMGKDMGFLVHFQHENIFRATSDVAPVNQLGSSAGQVSR
jgi:predicted amino acid-binding ACT domain protein